MKKLIAFAFLASLVVGSVGCKSDGNGYWCMKNPFYRRPQQVLAYPPSCDIPCVDNCCATPACGTTYGAPGCDCGTPSYPGGQIVDPAPFQ